MLNQVPRTLLNMGADGNERAPALSSGIGSLDWNRASLDDSGNITDGNDHTDGSGEGGGGGGEGAAPRMLTPHSKVFNSVGGRDGAEFDGIPQPAASPARRPASAGRIHGSSMERGSRREGTGVWAGGRGSMLNFTNERIADQALSEFGGGDVSPYFVYICTAASFFLSFALLSFASTTSRHSCLEYYYGGL